MEDNRTSNSVSIIVAVYNQEKYVAECLESLINQDINCIDIIIIDDGSTDGSSEICLDFKKKYPDKITYLKQKNGGLGAARNTGLRIAKGKYLMYVDADDCLRTNIIKDLIDYANKTRADIVYFDELVCDDNLTVDYINRTYPYMKTLINKKKAIRNCFNPAHMCARLYKREIFSNLKFKKIWYEDMEMFPQVLIKAKRIYYYKVPIYYYRQHANAITSRRFDLRNLDVIISWKNSLIMGKNNIDFFSDVEYAVKESLINFMYFRPECIESYLEFYNEFLCNDSGCNREHRINVMSFPIWQQANSYNNKEVVFWLKTLMGIYYNGGIIEIDQGCIKKYNYQVNNCDSVEIALENNSLFVKKIMIRKHSYMIYDLLISLSEINLVSLKGIEKNIDFSKRILTSCIMCGCQIKII